MKFSRDWLGDYIDLRDLSNDELDERFTSIGHAIESIEQHGDDTVFDLEITTNRVDAMSHLGIARELSAALGRELLRPAGEPRAASGPGSRVTIRIDAPELCSRYTGLVIRGVDIRPSPERARRRLEAVGLRPINNVVDATNYAMMALGHPLHAFDLAKLSDATIIVRRGNPGETIRSLDGETRAIDPQTVVIADATRAVALGGVIGGAESEISASTRDILLECAWFNPPAIRRAARRLGIRTDASYRFERRVDPNDTIAVIDYAGRLIEEWAGGTRGEVIDVVAAEDLPKTLVLRSAKLREASAGSVGEDYALALFRRLGFDAESVTGGIRVAVPSWRGDIHEEMDLVEEVLRFFGLNNVPAELPRLTTGDVRENPVIVAEDEVRTILAGCGLSEAINYSFVHADYNALFSEEEPISITNSLSENIAAMRLSLVPGLLETVAFNRSYGTRDGALFEVGRTYHRAGAGVREAHRAAIVLFGNVGSFWGDQKRPFDFFDVKGLVVQVAAKFHVALDFIAGGQEWLRSGKRGVGRHGDRTVATLGFLAPEVLQRFGVKGDVAAAEIDISALLASTGKWAMAPVARVPGVPMIMAMTHGRELEYQTIVAAIRSLEVPHLHEVGLRDRFVAESDPNTIKTTLGMWYQAFDRSLTQEEVSELQRGLASRIASMLPVSLL